LIEFLKQKICLIGLKRNPACFFESNPRHPGLKIERIINDPTAWSARADKRYRISFEPVAYLESESPDWSSPVKPLRILAHDDLYTAPR
jgi:hypothetical protein